jgi:hypothetical protein
MRREAEQQVAAVSGMTAVSGMCERLPSAGLLEQQALQGWSELPVTPR